MRLSLTRSSTRLTLCFCVLLTAGLLVTAVACSDSGESDGTPPPGEGETMPPGNDESAGGPLDETMIKNLTAAVSDFTPEQIFVSQHQTFGEWAAAFVSVEGQEGQLAVFRLIGSDWSLYDIGSYLDPEDLGPEVPAEVKNWAF